MDRVPRHPRCLAGSNGVGDAGFAVRLPAIPISVGHRLPHLDRSAVPLFPLNGGTAINSWYTPVDRALALRLLCPLPDADVVGIQQVARRGDTVIIAELSKTIRMDTWDGVWIRIASPTANTSNWFGFGNHHVFDESLYPRGVRRHELDRSRQKDLLRVDRIRATRLRDAVEVFTAAFAPPAAPEFIAAARLEGLSGLARRLDHVGSAYPDTLAGRALDHAVVLRAVATEIYLDLLPLVGERRAADSAPVGVITGLDNLRKLRTSLTELSDNAEQAGHGDAAGRFRSHAADLDAIDATITADLAAPAGPGTRASRRAATPASPSVVPAADRTLTATADSSALPATTARPAKGRRAR